MLLHHLSRRSCSRVHRGISALLHSACKLFAHKRYLCLPKGAAAFLPSAAIACLKPVFIIDAASALMLHAAIIQLISVAAFLLQLLYVLRTLWQLAEGFAAMSPPAALQPHQPSIPAPMSAVWWHPDAWKGSCWQAAPGDRTGVQGALGALSMPRVLTGTLRGFWKTPAEEKYSLLSHAETQA